VIVGFKEKAQGKEEREMQKNPERKLLQEEDAKVALRP
jgi:hypothetical protein